MMAIFAAITSGLICGFVGFWVGERAAQPRTVDGTAAWEEYRATLRDAEVD